MNCPVCRNLDTKVLDTRTSGDGIRRRRQCLACNQRFTTHERYELKLPLVMKRDGQREPFDRDKVLRGLRTACRKRPVDADTLDEAVDRLEQALVATGLPEVASAVIGRLVLDELLRIDHVGYVRFASVYLDFKSPSEFLALLQPLLARREPAAPGAARAVGDDGGAEQEGAS